MRDYREATVEDAKDWNDDSEKWLWCEQWLWGEEWDAPYEVLDRGPAIDRLEEHLESLLPKPISERAMEALRAEGDVGHGLNGDPCDCLEAADEKNTKYLEGVADGTSERIEELYEQVADREESIRKLHELIEELEVRKNFCEKAIELIEEES